MSLPLAAHYGCGSVQDTPSPRRGVGRTSEDTAAGGCATWIAPESRCTSVCGSVRLPRSPADGEFHPRMQTPMASRASRCSPPILSTPRIAQQGLGGFHCGRDVPVPRTAVLAPCASSGPWGPSRRIVASHLDACRASVFQADHLVHREARDGTNGHGGGWAHGVELNGWAAAASSAKRPPPGICRPLEVPPGRSRADLLDWRRVHPHPRRAGARPGHPAPRRQP